MLGSEQLEVSINIWGHDRVNQIEVQVEGRRGKRGVKRDRSPQKDIQKILKPLFTALTIGLE